MLPLPWPCGPCHCDTLNRTTLETQVNGNKRLGWESDYTGLQGMH